MEIERDDGASDVPVGGVVVVVVLMRHNATAHSACVYVCVACVCVCGKILLWCGGKFVLLRPNFGHNNPCPTRTQLW